MKIFFEHFFLIIGGQCALIMMIFSACASSAPSRDDNAHKHGTQVTAQTAGMDDKDDEFPSLEERQLLMLLNESRTDIPAALKGCTECTEAACYPPFAPPLFEDSQLNRSARFHAQMLENTGCFAHESPCQLKPSAARDYPACRTPECACTNAPQCSGEGMGAMNERIPLFKPDISSYAENIAFVSSGSIFRTHKALLWEKGDTAECRKTSANGHRWTMLNSDWNRVGMGYWNSYTAQDFTRDDDRRTPPLFSSGIHFVHPNFISFKTSLARRDADFSAPFINIDGKCYPMQRFVYNEYNAIWARDIENLPSSFLYRFEYIDAQNNYHFYPAQGSFQKGGSHILTALSLPRCAPSDTSQFDSYTPSPEVNDPCDKCLHCSACNIEKVCTYKGDIETGCEMHYTCIGC